MLIVENVISTIFELGVPHAITFAERSPYVKKLLKDFGLDNGPRSDSFEDVYSYALINYGIGKEQALVDLFGNKDIQSAFRQVFQKKDNAAFEAAIEAIRIDGDLDPIRQMDIDPNKQLDDFTEHFKKATMLSMSMGDATIIDEIKQVDEKLEKGFGNIGEGIEENAKGIEIIKECVLKLATTEDMKAMLLDNRPPMATRPNQKQKVQILIISPSDVADEGGMAKRTIQQIDINKQFANLAIEPIVMKVDSSPNVRIRPSEYDVVLLILWRRMGPPLDTQLHGEAPEERPYRSRTEQVFLDAIQSAAMHPEGKPNILVYLRTSKPAEPLDFEDPDFDEGHKQYQYLRNFCDEYLHNTDTDSRKHIFVEYKNPNEFKEDFDIAIKNVLLKLETSSGSKPTNRWLSSTDETTLQPAVTWPGSPFPGLRAFGPDDAPIFFGREHETDNLMKRLDYTHFMAVVGASGSGKSSLVGAGLIPRLQDKASFGREDWRYVHFTPDELGTGDPFAVFADALKKLEVPDDAVGTVIDQLREEPSKLKTLFEAAPKSTSNRGEVLFFIDQFEELFTSVDKKHRTAFVALLDQIARTKRMRVVVTMRADFYDQCVELPELNALVNENTYSLSAPDKPALRRMITRPAACTGLNFEDDLVDRILDDTGTEPGALALMGYTLDELYKRCKDNRVLTHDAYDTLGCVQGAIGTRAQHTFDALDTNAQATLTHVFRELVGVDERGTATRLRAPQHRVVTNGEAKRLVKAFTEARLLTTSRGPNNTPLIEVAHEALLRSWPRLATWIEDTQDDLRLLRQMRLAAKEWHANDEQNSFRWADERLQPVYKALDNLAIDRETGLNDIEQAFIFPEFKRLLEELKDPNTPHLRRNTIGERLEVLGDGGSDTGRHGVGLRGDGLPDIVWCKVPGGSVTLDDNAGTHKMKEFWIAKFPITYAQFQVFLDDKNGFNNDLWWDNLTESHRKQEMKIQRFAGNNRPRDSVSWYQAVAYTRWLDKTLPRDALPEDLTNLLTEPHPGIQWEIRLPTEWEWQQAATGGIDDRRYPWGDWDGRYANILESGLGRTTAVGMYPKGAVPENDTLDMIGTICEWCLNEHENAKYVSVKSSDYRVVRGGSYRSGASNTHCASRSETKPSETFDDLGFRVVCGGIVPG